MADLPIEQLERSNFIGASAELKRAFNEINCTKVKDKLLANKCDFLFNTPESSHMGGTVERHIQTVRSILNNILHTHGYRYIITKNLPVRSYGAHK